MADLVRPLLAALINDDLRQVLAETLIADAEPLTAARRARATEKLIATGILSDAEGGLTFDPAQVRTALQSLATPRREGVERFLTPAGKVDRYPSDHATRVELLHHLAHGVLQPSDRLTEPVLTERLRALADDPVLLRRHLVDYGVVQRTPGGEEYWLTAGQ